MKTEDMNALLVGHGYMGTAFAQQLQMRGWKWRHLSHDQVPGYCYEFGALPKVIINAAAYIPETTVADCESDPYATMMGNFFLPSYLARHCGQDGTILLHLSTGCLFDEKKPYAETDLPTRSFTGHCGVYLMSKWLSEKEVAKRCPNHYICRIRLPFDHIDHQRNYLSKLLGFKTVYTDLHSLSHRADCAGAMLDLIEIGAPFGTYHVANQGHICATNIAATLMDYGLMKNLPQYWTGPCPGTTLSIQKLLDTGVKIRSVEDAVLDAVKNWRKG